MNTFYIFLIRYRLVILFSFIALKLLLGARFWRGYSILYDQTLIYHILNIILYSIYLIFNVINILFYVAKYRLDRNIYYYEKNVYDTRNYESACGATFFWEIVLTVISESFVFYLIYYILANTKIKKIEKKPKEEKEKEKEMKGDSNEKLLYKGEKPYYD